MNEMKEIKLYGTDSNGKYGLENAIGARSKTIFYFMLQGEKKIVVNITFDKLKNIYIVGIIINPEEIIHEVKTTKKDVIEFLKKFMERNGFKETLEEDIILPNLEILENKPLEANPTKIYVMFVKVLVQMNLNLNKGKPLQQKIINSLQSFIDNYGSISLNLTQISFINRKLGVHKFIMPLGINKAYREEYGELFFRLRYKFFKEVRDPKDKYFSFYYGVFYHFIPALLIKKDYKLADEVFDLCLEFLKEKNNPLVYYKDMFYRDTAKHYDDLYTGKNIEEIMPYLLKKMTGKTENVIIVALFHHLYKKVKTEEAADIVRIIIQEKGKDYLPKMDALLEEVRLKPIFKFEHIKDAIFQDNTGKSQNIYFRDILAKFDKKNYDVLTQRNKLYKELEFLVERGNNETQSSIDKLRKLLEKKYNDNHTDEQVEILIQEEEKINMKKNAGQRLKTEGQRSREYIINNRLESYLDKVQVLDKEIKKLFSQLRIALWLERESLFSGKKINLEQAKTLYSQIEKYLPASKKISLVAQKNLQKIKKDITKQLQVQIDFLTSSKNELLKTLINNEALKEDIASYIAYSLEPLINNNNILSHSLTETLKQKEQIFEKNSIILTEYDNTRLLLRTELLKVNK